MAGGRDLHRGLGGCDVADREGRGLGGSRTLVGRLLHWSQPSRGWLGKHFHCWESFWGLVAHFPDKEIEAEEGA